MKHPAYAMDAIDRRILVELQADASIGNAELASRVGSSTASCWRRIKTMEAEGILTATVRLVDAVKVGRGVNVLCNVRLKDHARESTLGFETFVLARPEIMECFSMSGDWDYLLRIVAADVVDYDRFLMRTLLPQPFVGGASSHFALSMTKYSTSVPL